MTGAGIITYNPDIGLLQKNINAIIKQVDDLIIIDNGSDNRKDLDVLLKKYNIRSILNKENQGVAKALNQMMEWFEKKNFEWVLTLDQDTICPENLVLCLKQYEKEDVGIISPDFCNRNAERSVRKKVSMIESVAWTITSASLTNINAWKVVGGFDERLFIDGVDSDFGIRLNKAGYAVIKVNAISISHKIGDSFVKNFLGHQFLVHNHSAFRKYYIARNTIIVAKKNLGKKDIILSYLRVMKQLILVIMFEKKKKDKIQAIIQGILDSNKYFRKET